MQGRFSFACLLFERRQRDLGDYFQDFLFICFQKKQETLRIFVTSVCVFVGTRTVTFLQIRGGYGCLFEHNEVYVRLTFANSIKYCTRTCKRKHFKFGILGLNQVLPLETCTFVQSGIPKLHVVQSEAHVIILRQYYCHETTLNT